MTSTILIVVNAICSNMIFIFQLVKSIVFVINRCGKHKSDDCVKSNYNRERKEPRREREREKNYTLLFLSTERVERDDFFYCRIIVFLCPFVTCPFRGPDSAQSMSST